MASSIPAHQIELLYAALDAACNHSTVKADVNLWCRINAARAFVKVYLLDEIPPVAVDIDTREAA